LKEQKTFSFSAMQEETYDLVIVGGGVVGIAILRSATLQGYHCALIEKETHLLSHASGSNSGIACTGVDAAPGTLERTLIRDSNSIFRSYCKDLNVPTRPCGSLVCLWPWDDAKENHLDHVLDESHEAGDTHASRLSSNQVRHLEPNLALHCRGAVHIPGEIVVDPWLYSISLAAHARENGARIFTNFAFDPDASYLEGNIWNIFQVKPRDGSMPKRLRARAIANAAGLWSDIIQKKTHGPRTSVNLTKRTWSAKPRRGQYRIFAPSMESAITHPIQPIPTQRTKGIFVFSTIYNQIVVGPTALDQESKTDRSIDPLIAKELNSHVKRLIPGLDVKRDLVGEYVGVRPGTDKRDYQIHLYPEERWIAVAGIRSTGLTASLGIGNYVVRSLRAILDTPKKDMIIKSTPLPHLSSLVEDFHNRNGFVKINGFDYKVTHPLTILGWRAKEGIAGQASKL